MGIAKRKRDADALKCPGCKGSGRVQDTESQGWPWPVTKPCPTCVESHPSIVGRTRWSQDRTTWVKVLGCYGFGAGGLLYIVSLPNDADIRAPNGMAQDELDRLYPLNTDAKTRFERI